jgi:hypothetical protein
MDDAYPPAFAAVMKQTGDEKLLVRGAGPPQVRNDVKAVALVAGRHGVEQEYLCRAKP